MDDKLGNLEFLDEKHQREYLKDGFTLINSLINKSQIEDLKRVFFENFNVDDLSEIANTIAHTPSNVLKRVNEKINEICEGSLCKSLKSFRIVGSIFFIKKNHPDSNLVFHVDPSMTTEQYNNLGVWIPLIDINEETGQFCLLKNGHKLLPPYYTPSFPQAYNNVSDLLEEKSTCLSFNAGDAFVFNNNIVHSTKINKSKQIRIAVVIKLIDKNAPLTTVYYDDTMGENKKVSLYEHHDHDFILSDEFKSSTPPLNSEFKGYLSGLPKVLSRDEFCRLLHELNQQSK